MPKMKKIDKKRKNYCAQSIKKIYCAQSIKSLYNPLHKLITRLFEIMLCRGSKILDYVGLCL